MMKNLTLFVGTALIFLSLSASPLHAEGDDFANSALGRQLIDFGLKFLDNPGDFFFNLHSDNEDFSPVPDGRHGAVRFNLFPAFFPLTWGNINAKVKVLNDHGYVPQVDLVGMYGDLLALKMVDSDVKPTFSDYSLGAVVSKGVNEKTRLFGGFKYSAVNMSVHFSTPVAEGELEFNELDFQVAETFFFTGITHQSTPDKYLLAQLGYGFTYKKIVSRVMLGYRHLELGMDIFPEGLIVIHPFMAYHWYF